MKVPGPALWNAFADGAFVEVDNGITTNTRTLDAGHLTLPTGRIVASDPFLDPWTEPFTVRVPPGVYPVFLAIMQNDVALAMVSFGEGPPVSWQSADPPMFGVDSGHGCLMDQKVCRFLRQKAEADRYERYSKAFQEALDEGDGLWGHRCIDRESGANVVLFRTWGGDGRFASYFGYATDGSLACLVTDMHLADEDVVAVKTPGP